MEARLEDVKRKLEDMVWVLLTTQERALSSGAGGPMGWGSKKGEGTVALFSP